MTQEQLKEKAKSFANTDNIPDGYGRAQYIQGLYEGYIQGYQDGQEGSAGCWVKASERLPITPEQVIVRWLYLGEYGRIDLVSAHQLDHWVKSQVDPDYYEWLDESTPSTPLREAAEAMYKALKSLCEYWEWSIKDPAFREYTIAKQAIDNYEKLNK